MSDDFLICHCGLDKGEPYTDDEDNYVDEDGDPVDEPVCKVCGAVMGTKHVDYVQRNGQRPYGGFN